MPGHGLLLVSAVLLLSMGPGPAAGIPWYRTYGGAGRDEVTGLARCTDGGFALVGNSDSWSALDDAWLVRTDQSGALEWSVLFGGSSFDYLSSVVEEDDGGFLLSGTTYSSGAGFCDGWLVRTDSAGAVLWERTYGSPILEECIFSLYQCSDGSFVTTGYQGLLLENSTSMYLAGFDEEGELLWERQFGGGAQDCAFSVTGTADGGYLLAGQTGSGSAGSADGCVIKTDESGNLSWVSVVGGSEFDRFCHAVETPEGGVVAAGYSHSGINPACADMWLASFDDCGGFLWDSLYGGPSGNDDAEWIEVTPQGALIVCGFNGSDEQGGYDLWLLRLDGAGDVAWEVQFGGSDSDAGSCLELEPDGGILVGGRTRSYGAGDYDYLLLECDEDLGLYESPAPSVAELPMDILPNPLRSSAVISFSLPSPGKACMMLFDISGRVVRTLIDDDLQAGVHTTILEGSDLPVGVYICRLVQGNSSGSKTLVRLR